MRSLTTKLAVTSLHTEFKTKISVNLKPNHRLIAIMYLPQ